MEISKMLLIRSTRFSFFLVAALALFTVGCFAQRITGSSGAGEQGSEDLSQGDKDQESGDTADDTSDEGDDDDAAGDDDSGNENDAGSDDTGGGKGGDDSGSDQTPDEEEEESTDFDLGLPPFVDDCAESLNDDFSSLAGLQAIDEQEYSSIQLCNGESDWYQINVPAESWLSVEIQIDGSGSGASDLDLYEVNTASEGLQASYTEQSYERVAVYNDSLSTTPFYFAVLGYQGASADYDIIIRVSDWHEGEDCDDYYPASAATETGPCNRIMQHPRANQDADGYFVEHQAHYSNIRREVAYLIDYAAGEVYDAFPGTNPLALMDMSETDGSTPGAMVSSLRHPEGTHVDGNDMDIAYYQTGADNAGRVVCENDGYFCTEPPNILDAERTAYFMATLFDSGQVRVIGVDTLIAEEIYDAADDLLSSGMISQSERDSFDTYMAYGEGWPFHHHHLHFSWYWESGFEGRSVVPDGCMLGPVSLLSAKEPQAPFPLLF